MTIIIAVSTPQDKKALIKIIEQDHISENTQREGTTIQYAVYSNIKIQVEEKD